MAGAKLIKDALTQYPLVQVTEIKREYLRSAFRKTVAHTIDLMLVFLGSSNEAVKEIGHESLSLLMNSRIVGFDMVYERFLEADNSKKLNVAKFTTARLKFMYELVEAKVVNHRGLVDFAISHLRNAN